MLSFLLRVGLAVMALTSIVAILPDVRAFPDGLNSVFTLVLIPGFHIVNAMFPVMSTVWIIVSLVIYIKIVLWIFTATTWAYNKLSIIV